MIDRIIPNRPVGHACICCLAACAFGLASQAGAVPQYRAVSFAELGYPEKALINDRGQWVATAEGGILRYFDGLQVYERALGGEPIELQRINEEGDVWGENWIRVRMQTPDGETEIWERYPFLLHQDVVEFWGLGMQAHSIPTFLSDTGRFVGVQSHGGRYGGSAGFVADGDVWETFDADMTVEHGNYAGSVSPLWMNRSDKIVGMASYLVREDPNPFTDFIGGGPAYIPYISTFGFVRENGVRRQLALPGASSSVAACINDADVILGTSEYDLVRTAFVASPGVIARWDGSSPAQDITPYTMNNLSVVVGVAPAEGDAGVGEYLLWRASAVRTLEPLIDFSGVEARNLSSVLSILDSGRIVVDAVTPQQITRRLLLLPVQPASPTRLVNVSARAATRSGEGTLILGVVNAGGENRVLARAVGPGLAGYDVPDVAADPRLDLFRSGTSGSIDGNDQWGEGADPAGVAAAATQVGAFSLNVDSKDAALLASVSNTGYTVHATAAAPGGEGIALAEIYEAPQAGSTGRLVNASVRMWVGTGDEIGIVGFVLSGEFPSRVLIRAVGPGLSDHGVSEYLANPQLFVYRGQDPTLGNDDWGTARGFPLLASVTTSVGAFPLEDGSADAALPLELEPGAYTVHVSGADGGTGVALVEIYLIEEP